jgi:hypothetical protein
VNFPSVLTLQRQILGGTFTTALWQQENDELIAGLQLEEESFSTDRALARQLQALWGNSDAFVSPFATEEAAAAFAFGSGRQCKVIGCTESHARHFCKVSDTKVYKLS